MGDYTGDGVKVVAGQNIVFDFQGFTYTLNDNTVGSTGTETNGFQLLKGSVVTFKNGTIHNSTTKGAKIMLQNYSDLTLDNFTVDVSMSASGYGTYAVSNNYGSLTVKNGSNIIASSQGVAFDLWYGMSSVYDEGVMVIIEDTAGTISGPIEYGAASRITDRWEDKAILSIEGGTFENFVINITTSNYEASQTGIEIIGGIFDADPSSYVDTDNYSVTLGYDDNYYVMKKY